MLRRLFDIMRAVILVHTAAVLVGCGSFVPPKVEDPAFERHAITKEKSNVTLTVAVLAAWESLEFFGVPLESEGIQAVWLKVTNGNDYAVYIVPRSTDPNYYSAYEAAYVNHRAFNRQSNLAMDDFFRRSRIRLQVPAHQTNTGFLFTNLSEGTKFVNIEMVHDEGAIRDGFFFQLPNGAFDYEKARFDSPQVPIQPLTLKALRDTIEALPCCTTDATGTRNGDPVNFVLIGSDDDILGALTRQGWDPTHALGAATAWSTFHAYISAVRYRYSPISSLYFYGRRQDIAMQKTRATIHQRNHLRLWKAPYSYQGKSVWIGQISRDIGVRFAVNAPFFVTHVIEPDVDEARSYLIQDMLASEYLHAFGWLNGVGRAGEDHPRVNLTGDPYFTDGLRAVMVISSKPASIDEIKLLDWDSSSE
jgi:LssY-like putative type I secretion system component LssY